MEAATLLLGWGRMQARCVRGEGGVMWNEPKRPRTESRRMGKVDRKAKKGSNSPSIPNCLVSTLLGQTIVLCRFKLDFTLRKSASIDISDSEFRRRYGGVGVVLRHPIRVLLVDAQLTDPTGARPSRPSERLLQSGRASTPLLSSWQSVFAGQPLIGLAIARKKWRHLKRNLECD